MRIKLPATWCCMAVLLLGLWRPALAAPIRLTASSTSFGQAVLELQADELVTMQVLPFRLILADENGAPLAGAAVRCAMDMPSMPMPDNRPQVVADGDAYRGEMIFTCAAGAWRITFDAQLADGRHQGATFYVEQVRMP